MVASAILACAVLSVAQLVAAGIGSTAGAREVSEATLLAWQKLDELRALGYAVDDAGQPVTDVALTPSGNGTLSRDTVGYVEYLDAWGEPLPGDAGLPAGTRYRRRWAIESAAGNPDLLVLRVRVLAVGRDGELAGATTLRARRRP